MSPHSSGTRRTHRHDAAADQTTTTAATSSSTVEPFPPVTESQRSRIEQTLAQLPDGARTWADLTSAQQRLERGGPGRDDHDENEEDDNDGLYELWLKLVWQDGITWRDKWDNVKRQVDLPYAPRRGARDEERQQRTHRRRPSDNLDLLREKLDRISIGLAHGQPDQQARQPVPPSMQPRRPHSTPPRPLLVPPPPPEQTATRLGYGTDEHAHGYLSSDDQFAGVPTPRQRRLARLALPPRAERGPFTTTTTDEDDSSKPPAAHQPSRSRQATHVEAGGESTPEVTMPPPVMSTPVRPSAAHGSLDADPKPEPDPTPLLSARLSTLQSQPPAEVVPPRPPLSPAPSSSLLIGATFSQPEAVSRALQFSRLRLLLPLFTHWSNKTRVILAREAELELRRGDWLKRCAVESWRIRLGRIGEQDAAAREFARKRVRRLVVAAWRERVREREKRKRVADLTSARDTVIQRRDTRLVHAAYDKWRFRAADRVVSRRRANNLARAALLTWRRRLRARASRTRALEEVAEERWDRWELGRAKTSWTWWIRRTALRVKEDAIRNEKDEQVKATVLSRWHHRA